VSDSPTRTVPRFDFDPVHRSCRCPVCVHARIIRMLNDLDACYDPQPLPLPKPERVQ
jgi:hypothetical protein